MKLFSLLTLSVFASTAQAQEKPDAAAKELIRQWVATERFISAEKATWKREQAQTSELLALYTNELKLLSEELEKTGKSVAEVDMEKTKLQAKIDDALSNRIAVRNFLLKLKPRLIALEKQFPTALQTDVNEAMVVIRSANVDSSARDLLQSTINVIESATSFNERVFHTQETVKIGSDTLQADVLYLGLGRAFFYVGKNAGFGVPSASGWVWKRDDSKLAEIKKAIQVIKKSTQPQLVELPLQLSK